MKESLFIKQNKQKWKDLEKHLASDQKDPDKLSDLYIQISDDLSYARTFYPNRSVRLYLNNLAQQVYSNIYKSRRSRWSDFVFFWKEELPKIVWDSKKELSISFFVFILAVSIGVFSAIQDPGFVRVILGDEYVDMTLQNIKNGDPMAVYKASKNTDMFMGITLNNVRIDFMTFASGLFLGIGSILIMFYNGIMVGVFQFFFVQQDLFIESALTIWLHGTLEMSGMVLAGAAGIRLGSGLVFPGSYSRLQAFQRSAMNGFKLLMGTVPITIFAAIIESFLTRYTQTPDSIRFILILLSLLFIITYFIIYPYIKSKKGFSEAIKQTKVIGNDFTTPNTEQILTHTELIRSSFSMFHHYFFSHAKTTFTLLLLSIGIISISLHNFLPEYIDYTQWFFFTFFFELELPVYVHALHVFNLSVLLFFVGFNIHEMTASDNLKLLTFGLQNYYKALITALLIYPIVWIPSTILVLIAFALITPPLLIIYSVSITEKSNYWRAISIGIDYMSKQYMNVVGLFILLSGCMALYYLFIESPITYFLIQFIFFNFEVDAESLRWMYIILDVLFYYGGFFYLLPLCMYGTMWNAFGLKEIKYAQGLTSKMNSIWK